MIIACVEQIRKRSGLEIYAALHKRLEDFFSLPQLQKFSSSLFIVWLIKFTAWGTVENIFWISLFSLFGKFFMNHVNILRILTIIRHSEACEGRDEQEQVKNASKCLI